MSPQAESAKRAARPLSHLSPRARKRLLVASLVLVVAAAAAWLRLRWFHITENDAKVLAVPIPKVLPHYARWQKPEDLSPARLNAIAHFFEHYKDLEPNKWVKILGWEGPDAARKEITDGMAAYEKNLKA